MKHCVFCEIVNNLESAAKVYENHQILIFLDRRPLFKGHCLLIPKEHFETLDDLPQDQITPFFTKLQEINQVVRLGMNSVGTFVAMNNRVSQSVPHLHFHIVPRTPGDGLKGFFWPRHRYSVEELEVVSRKLQAAWHDLYG
jgi:histidine triad (HIT) family protein